MKVVLALQWLASPLDWINVYIIFVLQTNLTLWITVFLWIFDLTNLCRAQNIFVHLVFVKQNLPFYQCSCPIAITVAPCPSSGICNNSSTCAPDKKQTTARNKKLLVHRVPNWTIAPLPCLCILLLQIRPTTKSGQPVFLVALASLEVNNCRTGSTTHFWFSRLFRCASISWFQVVSKSLTHFVQIFR